MSSALTYLHFLTPLLLFPPVSTLFIPLAPPPEPLPGIRPITVQRVIPRRQPISTSLLLLALSAFLDIVILVADLVTAKSRYGEHVPAHLEGSGLASAIVYALGGLAIYGSALGTVWWRARWTGNPLVVFGTLGLVVEIPNLVLLVIHEIRTHGYNNIFSILSIPPSALRILLFTIVLGAAAFPRITYEPADESTGLLAEGRSEYGTFDANAQNSQPQNKPAASTTGQQRVKITKKLGGKRKVEQKKMTFRETMLKLKTLIPRLWPSTSIKLQFYIIMTMVTIGIKRLINPLPPILLGLLVRALTDGDNAQSWKYLWYYLGFRLLGGNSVLGIVQQLFWTPVVQYTDREMSMMCFNHLLNLSLAYHTKRNTGELLRIVDRGSAINELFRTILFSVLPCFADIAIGFTVFIWLFGPGLTAVVLALTIPYCAFSVISTYRRQALRKAYNEADIKQWGISSDVLHNWESVKYFTSEVRETGRFQEAYDDLLKIGWTWTIGSNAVNAFQSTLLTIAFSSGAIIIAWRILHGSADAAIFVIYLQYFDQFTRPLDDLASLYRTISSNITDATRMLELLAEKTEINDMPDAPDLVVTDGVIEFDNVTFSYDGTVDAIKNISFKVGKGESMALVGETGSGKSTILRLLYRFYDIQSGHIYIDGQDISKVSQVSLRRAIGIVPQDSVLWNDTIGANIAYGRPEASDEEVIAAARAGMIHDKIMTFEEGYDTICGERGVRLSGGERQRVSLSRMFLKSPAILVLDEATSALDTETEREIQKSLWKLAEGRTSLSIAHRLSTIINSDKIVVMKKGEIVEIGGYKDLVEMNGFFAKMWKHQIYTEAELLEQSDIKKIASVVPNSEGYLKAFAGSGTATPGTIETPKVADSGESTETETVEPDAARSEESTQETAATDAEGFVVSSDSPAVTSSLSYADAVKEPSTDDQDAPVESLPAPVAAAAKATEESAPAQKNPPITYAAAVKADNGESDDLPVPDETTQSATVSTSDNPVEQQAAPASTSPGKSTSEETTAVNSSRLSVEFDTPEHPPRSSSRSPEKTSPEPSVSASTGAVPFPSAPATGKTSTFPAPNPKRMSTSTSILSGISETVSSSPTQSQSQSHSDAQSQNEVPADGGAKADKRRKRLSSIKGFVRRISDQGASLTRSPSGLRSPASELPPEGEPEDERTRLRSGSSAQAAQGDGSQTQGNSQPDKAGSSGSHKNKKKKKHGK